MENSTTKKNRKGRNKTIRNPPMNFYFGDGGDLHPEKPVQTEAKTTKRKGRKNTNTNICPQNFYFGDEDDLRLDMPDEIDDLTYTDNRIGRSGKNNNRLLQFYLNSRIALNPENTENNDQTTENSPAESQQAVKPAAPQLLAVPEPEVTKKREEEPPKRVNPWRLIKQEIQPVDEAEYPALPTRKGPRLQRVPEPDL